MDLHAAARTVGILATLGGGGVATASGQVATRPVAVVYVINEAGASREVITTAQVNVVRIYDSIGVAVVWTDDLAGSPAALILKIVQDRFASRLGAGPGYALGVALRGKGHSRFAYVFYNRIEHVTHSRQLDVSAVLGATIAHELGHLLLPYGSHTPRGLMSADWSDSDLRTADRHCLDFTDEQGKLIRTGLETRAR